MGAPVLGAERCVHRRLVLGRGLGLRQAELDQPPVVALERGVLLLAPFPYSDLRGMKRRPVCVVSSEAYNAGPDAIVTMVTSSGARRANLGIGDVSIEETGRRLDFDFHRWSGRAGCW